MRSLKIVLLAFFFIFTIPEKLIGQEEKPNLIIIYTDEHNFRTLGCYRDLMTEDQAFVWGKGVEVKTPHIDRIANEGAICNNFYASSPVCTPSRASFVSGLYPVATNSYQNDRPMFDHIETFASVLKREGYATSYLGKWHLDGDAKPGFEPKRKFGFDDNKYMFNRGHWKALEDDAHGNPKLSGKYNPKNQRQTVNVKATTAADFTTDYLTNKALDILERDKDKPFCLMLSIPDPHTPNTVRPPYDTMYEGLHFEKPKTMKVPAETMPNWAGAKGKNYADHLEQDKMQRYFGMVKCIDDNIGRILKFLDDNKLTDNTIIIFSSDHGDLMGEHHKHNKGNPYETSAKIPFVLRFPAKVKAGKVIRKAYTSVDFAPTILGLIGASPLKTTAGIDASVDFKSKKKDIADDRITYMTSSHQNWAAALTNRYKLVLSVADKPWLIDLQEDPDELINFYTHPKYQKEAVKLQGVLLKLLEKHNDPILKSKKPLILK